MLRYIFLSLFVVIQVPAAPNDIMKLKARHKYDTVYVKALIHYPTIRNEVKNEFD